MANGCPWRVVLLAVGLAALARSAFAATGGDAADIVALTAKLERQMARNSCEDAVTTARELLTIQPEHLPALKAIERCSRGVEATGKYASLAREMFENSEVLSIIPELLDMANVKDLVPIIKEVETHKRKSVGDYLLLNQIYEKLGEPDKQIRALEAAVNADRDDPRPKLILASKRFDAGDKKGARILFRDYLWTRKGHFGREYLLFYVAAMAYPWHFAITAILANISLGAVLFRRKKTQVDTVRGQFQGVLGRYFCLVAALLVILPVLQLVISGSAVAFGLVVALTLILTVALAWPLVQKVVLKPLWRAAAALLNGIRVARVLEQIPTGWRILLAMTSLFVMGTVVPVLGIPDLRYALTAVCSLLFYGTVGSILVSLLRASRSLESSMKWIGIAATLPFLMSYVIAHWRDIGSPFMHARLPTIAALEGLMNYAIFWGVSVALSLHLSKILSRALIEPVLEIMDKVRRIEGGDFKAKVAIRSRDEIGALSQAVNTMAIGLERREFVEKTFTSYVDKEVATRILAGRDGEVRVAGERMQATVLFADISNFTSLSERLPPEAVVQLLNSYFEHMVKVIKAHGGVIDKYIGDCILCVWGVPNPVANASAAAVDAALTMMREMALFNAERVQSQGYEELAMTIGINSGSLVAGSIGSSQKMEYTIIGDVVNTAQRAQATARPGEILVTDEVYNEAGGVFAATPLGEHRVKGKAAPVRLWRITSRHQLNGSGHEIQQPTAA